MLSMFTVLYVTLHLFKTSKPISINSLHVYSCKFLDKSIATQVKYSTLYLPTNERRFHVPGSKSYNYSANLRSAVDMKRQ